MKVAAIIAEYNPFHEGHAHQIALCRELTGCDAVIALMSGCFVQRGTPALLEPYTRASLALAGGADCVLGLPVLTATASAEGFALGAIRLAAGLKAVTHLCFGVEVPAGQTAESVLQALRRIAKLLREEPAEYTAGLKELLASGLSYPLARARALHAILPQDTALLDTPNNILALEYCKALLDHPHITAVPIERKGAQYHDSTLEEFCSATALRTHFSAHATLPDCGIPKACRPVYEALLATNSGKQFMTYEDFSLPYLLAVTQAPLPLAEYFDVTDELAARIEALRDTLPSIEALAATLKHRQITRSSVDRALCHIFLGLTKEDKTLFEACGPVPYSIVYGCKKHAASLLGHLQTNGSVPLLVRQKQDVLRLSEEARRCYEKELRAMNLYAQVVSHKLGAPLPLTKNRGFFLAD